MLVENISLLNIKDTGVYLQKRLAVDAVTHFKWILIMMKNKTAIAIASTGLPNVTLQKVSHEKPWLF